MNESRPLSKEVGGYFISRLKALTEGAGGIVLKTTAVISGAASKIQQAELDDALSEVFL